MRKERFGKFLSVALSIAMVLSLSVTALAAEGETHLTIIGTCLLYTSRCV